MRNFKELDNSTQATLVHFLSINALSNMTSDIFWPTDCNYVGEKKDGLAQSIISPMVLNGPLQNLQDPWKNF